MDRIRNSRTVQDADRPHIPGERSRNAFTTATRQDRVKLDKNLFEAIRCIADE